ncbi:DUF3617 domain-containing protein [Burkholderiaceae bacterium DAT-1]|nr:DUF3617 domain-containing protein [Burkholderiaceae bacterium DAT-1]
MKIRHAVGMTTALLCIFQSHAEVIHAKIEPGLWERTSNTTVNGQNMEAALNKMQEQILAKAKPEEREIMLKHMKAKGSSAGRHLECITPEAVAQGLDTEKMRQQIQSDHPNCQARLLNVTPRGAKYDLTCTAPNGGSQHAVGELELKSEKEWTFHAVSSGDIVGAPAGTSKIQASLEARAIWKGSSCGDVRPIVR